MPAAKQFNLEHFSHQLNASKLELCRQEWRPPTHALQLEALSPRVVVSPHSEGTMVIGERLKALREQKKMSQGDIENRTGLLRCYISRAENGHSVPAIETLEKIARAMEVPLYQLFYDGEEPPAPVPKVDDGWGGSGRDARTLGRFRRLLRRTSKADQELLMFMAQEMSRRRKRGMREKRAS